MKFAASVVLAVFLGSTAYAAPAAPTEAGTVMPATTALSDASSSAPAPSSSFFGSAAPSSAIATSVGASSAAPTSVVASSAISSVAPTALSSLSHRPASSSSAAPPASETVPFAPEDPNPVLWSPNSQGTPQPQRGTLGSTILGPQDVSLDQQNPDLLAPPTTDSGTM